MQLLLQLVPRSSTKASRERKMSLHGHHRPSSTNTVDGHHLRHWTEPEDCSQNQMISAWKRSWWTLTDKDLRGREVLSPSEVRGPLPKQKNSRGAKKTKVLYKAAKWCSNHCNVSSPLSQELRWFTFLLGQILNTARKYLTPSEFLNLWKNSACCLALCIKYGTT